MMWDYGRCVTFQSSVGYNMYQIGEPCSFAHSSTVELPTVERNIISPLSPGARPTAISLSANKRPRSSHRGEK